MTKVQGGSQKGMFASLGRLPGALAAGAALVLWLPAAAWARQSAVGAPLETRMLLEEPAPRPGLEIPELEPAGSRPALPPSLAALPPGGEPTGDVGIGPIFGILKTHKADHDSLFAGVELRLQLADFLGIELDGSLHRAVFLNDTVRLTQYPVQAVAKIFPWPTWELQPYLEAGAGWYYSKVQYRFPLNAQFQDKNQGLGAPQAGAGVEFRHGSGAAGVTFDYVFLDLTADGLPAHSFQYWEVVANVTFFF